MSWVPHPFAAFAKGWDQFLSALRGAHICQINLRTVNNPDVETRHCRVSIRRGLESIAAFTLKNAFVADYMHDEPFFGTQTRRLFKEHRQFPLGMYMWIGGVETERKVRHGLMKSRYGKPTVDSPNGIKTYVFTWSAESLLFQLVAARWTNVLMYSRNGWPNIWQERRLDNTFVPFWPITRRRIAWPPQSMVSHNHLDIVADRFTTIRLN